MLEEDLAEVQEEGVYQEEDLVNILGLLFIFYQLSVLTIIFRYYLFAYFMGGQLSNVCLASVLCCCQGFNIPMH